MDGLRDLNFLEEGDVKLFRIYGWLHHGIGKGLLSPFRRYDYIYKNMLIVLKLFRVFRVKPFTHYSAR
ncbi:hypothetical protein Hanom_Chr10g00893911 [Helianthus anomalus]